MTLIIALIWFQQYSNERFQKWFPLKCITALFSELPVQPKTAKTINEFSYKKEEEEEKRRRRFFNHTSLFWISFAWQQLIFDSASSINKKPSVIRHHSLYTQWNWCFRKCTQWNKQHFNISNAVTFLTML